MEYKSFAECAPLVSKVNENALAVHGRERCDGEHVLGDDVSLEIIKSEVPLGILSCCCGVCKSVNSSSGYGLVVPVVKEIIVKERTSDKAVLIETDLESSLEEMSHKETILRN